MAISRAELQSMDRDELIETVADLSSTVENFGLALERTSEARKDLSEVVTDLEDRVNSLESENKRLRARLDDADTKEAKVAAIVRAGVNVREGKPAVKLTAKDIKIATGCSRRYAYDLIDDLPEEYDWFLTPTEMKQYGSLQIDNTDARRLGIDFEGVHSGGCPVAEYATGEEV